MKQNQLIALLVTFTGFASILRPIIASADAITLKPTSDFRILAIDPSHNDSTVLSVYNDGHGNVQHSILQFDFSSIPVGATIDSATLTLYIAYANLQQPSGTHSDVYALAHLTDSTANWFQASIVVPWTTFGGDVTGAAYAINSDVISGSYIGEPVSWDVTSLVSAWEVSAQPNYGMLLAATPGDQLHFYSATPSLSIIYTVPAPSLSIMRNNTNLVFSWLTNAQGFTLEFSTNLLTGSWSAVTNSAVIMGANYFVGFNPTQAQGFFRLKKRPCGLTAR